MLQSLRHTPASQTLPPKMPVKGLDDIQQNEQDQIPPGLPISRPKQQTSFESQLGLKETLVPNTYLALDYMNFNEGIIAEHE